MIYQQQYAIDSADTKATRKIKIMNNKTTIVTKNKTDFHEVTHGYTFFKKMENL